MVDKIKMIMMCMSFVLVVICFAASLWMALSLPSGDADVSTFSIFAFIFLAAAVWLGYNAYNLFKSEK
jgi:hypothetical protein